MRENAVNAQQASTIPPSPCVTWTSKTERGERGAEKGDHFISQLIIKRQMRRKELLCEKPDKSALGVRSFYSSFELFIFQINKAYFGTKNNALFHV